jgi:hypothetical protein
MIIGIVGFIGSGKGTAADILVNKHNFHKLSFADTVKDATAAIFGWPRNLLEGDTEESRNWREAKDEWWSERFGYDISPRLALQMMGTEAGRDVFHSDLWIHSLERKMEMYPNVVIADVRFPNEIAFIQSKGGFVIRVKRGADPEWYDTALIANQIKDSDERFAAREKMINQYNVHYSEWAWIGSIMEHELYNTGTISSLEGDIIHMLKVFTGPQKPATLAA